MSEAVRVLHFADVHIGMENYGRVDASTGVSSRVRDFLARMDEMIAFARQNDVDLVVFAGDAFKTRTPNPTYQREFAWRVRELAELAPVILLEGNHDLQANQIKASSIEIYNTLSVENVLVAQEYDVMSIETKRGPVIIGTAPYPIRARLMQEMDARNLTVGQLDSALEASLIEILGQMAVEADALDTTGTTPRLLTGHFTVRGAALGSERSVMLGRDVQISLNLLADQRWDYVALGHVHKHQNLTHNRDEAPPVVYSGSIERIDFGEESDPKGYCWVKLERGKADWQFCRVDARPMVTLRMDCRKDPHPTGTVIRAIKSHHLEGAIVRLLVKLSPETNAVLKDGPVREALRESGVFHVAALSRDVDYPDRARLNDNPEGLSHEELLEQYFKQRGYDHQHQQRLLAAAQPILFPDQQ